MTFQEFKTELLSFQLKPMSDMEIFLYWCLYQQSLSKQS